MRNQLETLLREIGHRDAPALSRVLFGAIDGVAQHYVLNPDEYPLATTAECLARHFCQRPTEPAQASAATARPRASARLHRNTRSTRRKPHDPEA